MRWRSSPGSSGPDTGLRSTCTRPTFPGSGAELLFAVTRKNGIEISLLANNAGYGTYGTFDSIDPRVEEGMIDLDIKALVRLTLALRARDAHCRVRPNSPDCFRRRRFPPAAVRRLLRSKGFRRQLRHGDRQELRGTGAT